MSEIVKRAVVAFMANAREQLALPELMHNPAYADHLEIIGINVSEAIRAAIEAMREPTPDMVEAGRWPAEDDGPVACWQAMVDQALKPEP